MSIIYKDTTRVDVSNSTTETTLFSLDLDRLAILNGGLPMGPNQALRFTCYGGILENSSGLTTPNAYFEFHFGNLQVDQIIYVDDWHHFKATFDLVLNPHNTLLYGFQ